MAVRFDASGDWLSNSSNLVDYNAAYTFMGWIYISSDTNDFQSLFVLYGDDNNYDDITLDADGVTLASFIAIGGAFQKQLGTTLSLNTWYHIAAVRSSSTAINIYLNGVSDPPTNTRNVGARSAITEYRLGRLTAAFPLRFDGRMFGVKSWNVALSQAEVLQEMHSISPKTNYANLNRWSPILTGDRTRDYGPFRADWTENGTLTDEASPPVSWGAPIVYVNNPAGGGAEQGTISEGAESAESFSVVVRAPGNIVAGAESDATMRGIGRGLAAITAGAEAGDSVSVIARAVSAIVAAAESDDSASTVEAMLALVNAGGIADETASAVARAAAAITAGAQAGESWVAVVNALADWQAAAEGGDLFSGDTEGLFQAAISEGSESAAEFLAACRSLGTLTATATTAEAISTTAQALALIAEQATAGATFSATVPANVRQIVETANSTGLFSASPRVVAGITAGVLSTAIFSAVSSDVVTSLTISSLSIVAALSASLDIDPALTAALNLEPDS